MHKVVSIGLIFALLLSVVPQFVKSAPFAAIAVRPDRQTRGLTDVRYLITVEPVSVATESKLKIAFGEGMGVDAVPSNITVTTAGLPATFEGVALTPWPLDGTSATAVSGKEVTFDTQDLTPGTRYAFYITAGIDNPTLGFVEQPFDFTTLDSGSAVIDSGRVFVPYNDSDQVAVAASVAPTEKDFDIAVSTTSSDTAAPGEVRTYIITYSSHTINPQSFTLEVEWTKGSVSDGSDAFNVANYVLDSVTTGHDSVGPTVDLNNRRITWNITDFPGNTTKTVSWQLKTADTVGTTSEVSYSIRGRLSRPGVTVESNNLPQTYQYTAAEDSPQPTPKAVAPTPSPTGTEPLAPVGLTVTDLQIVAISDTEAVVEIVTNSPAAVRIRYGEEGEELAQEAVSSTPTTFHRIELTQLLPDNRYVFTLEAIGEDGEILTLRELFSFRTATQALANVLDLDHIVLSAQGVVLINQATPRGQPVLLPVGASFDITLPFKESLPAQVHMRFRNQQVRGISTAQAAGYVESVRLLETEPSVYSGRFVAPELSGRYDLLYEIRDVNGNLTSDVLGSFRLTEPLLIVDAEGQPVESAHVYLEIRDPLTGEYERFPGEGFGLTNPIKTGSDGVVPIVLPTGEYRVTVNALGYETTASEFSFSAYENDRYPSVVLPTASFSFMAAVRYYLIVGKDTLTTLSITFDDLAASNRYFKLVLLLGVVLLSGLSGLLVLTLRGWTHMLAQPFRRFSRGRALLLWLASSAGHLLSDFIIVILLTFHIALIVKLGFPNAVWVLLLTLGNLALWAELKVTYWRHYFMSPEVLRTYHSS